MTGKAESITENMVRLSTAKHLGNLGTEAIGELIVADATFNMWFVG